mmetsp:Transcript_17086/g.25810  ORF Transcript_17086/g.25810 Transcript_17086/m.25810 type:complete len:151 (+) Transcript_17086:123-575(+)
MMPVAVTRAVAELSTPKAPEPVYLMPFFFRGDMLKAFLPIAPRPRFLAYIHPFCKLFFPYAREISVVYALKNKAFKGLVLLMNCTSRAFCSQSPSFCELEQIHTKFPISLGFSSHIQTLTRLQRSGVGLSKHMNVRLFPSLFQLQSARGT